jgi:hypothetical protein
VHLTKIRTHKGTELNQRIEGIDNVSKNVREPFANFVDWRQCTAVMQKEAVTVMSIYSGGGNVVVVLSSSP